METVKLFINGVEVETTPDKTILEAVHDSGLDKIPTLCHDKRLEHFTSCFLCVVEVEGVNRLLPACSTKVNAGWKVSTNTETIRESRKSALELLLSNHYADCIGPCRNNCPAEVDAQAYIALISLGKYKEALQLVKQNNPLPLSIGRVCVRDCEQACRRNYVDEPVAVNTLKRYVADIDSISKWTPELKPANGKKVAIIGSGPAGLTCAYFLTLEGYRATIYEKLDELGGMLRYGIPEYRLPKNILDSEIEWILNLGVEVKKGLALGRDFSVEDLQKEGYQAVFVGVGAHKASKLGLDGEEKIVGVYRGIEFLREVTEVQDKKQLGKDKPLKGNVIVVGGGNTAIDAARTALRSGAETVKIVYRRSIKEMPAHPEEIHAAQHEGVEILFLTNPKSMVVENGQLKGIECLQMELVAGKPGERPRPVAKEGSEFVVPCDYIISAIGQNVDTTFVEKDKNLTLEKWGTVTVNQDTLETSIPGVFAGGDAVTGPLTAISSIAQGRKAADAIMSYLEKGKAAGPKKKFYSLKHRLTNVTEKEFSTCSTIAREKMEELDATDRIHSFEEVEKGITEEQSHHEVERCLECGCSEFYDCTLRKYSDEYEIDVENVIGEVTKYKIDERHPFILFDPNKCINCGKCVRVCSDIMRVTALGFVHRGFKSVVKPSMEKPLTETPCIVCGNCIDVCPTGAIAEKFPFKILGTLPKQDIETVCGFCSVGCKLNYKKIDNDIFYISNSTDSIQDTHNQGFLCLKGRFGHRYLMQKNRVFSPMINDGNGPVPAELDDALGFAGAKLKEIAEKYGKESIAVFASPKLSNEELYMLQRLARKGIGTNNIGSFSLLRSISSTGELDAQLGFTASTVSAEALKKADVIVVMNSDLTEENLVMEVKIKLAKKQGAKLVLIHSEATALAKHADLWIDSTKGTNTLLFNTLVKSLMETGTFNLAASNVSGAEAFMESVQKLSIESLLETTGLAPEQYSKLLALLGDASKNVVFVYNCDSVSDKSAGDLQAVVNYLAVTGKLGRVGNGLLLMREHNNGAGMMDMGAVPAYLPGYARSGVSADYLAKNLREGRIRAALIFGEDPFADENATSLLKSAEFLLVCDTHISSSTMAADVVLPANTLIEQEGTYTRCDHVVESSTKVIQGLSGIDNLVVIRELLQKFGDDSGFVSNQEIRGAITKETGGKIRFDLGDASWTEKYFSNGFRANPTPLIPYIQEELSVTEESVPLTYADRYYKAAIEGRLKK